MNDNHLIWYYKKDHTADYSACCVVFLFAPLEDVTQTILSPSLIRK